MRRREAYARGILESLGTPTAVVDGDGVIREVNRAWRDNDVSFGAELATVGVGVDYRQVCRGRHTGSSDAARVLDALEAVLTHTDVTWRHEAQRRLELQARTDPLTGLANRSGLLAVGAGAMARARRTGQSVTVLFIDLDAFKPINDRYGHQAGDEVLRQRAQRLVQVVRETDEVARVGGDEFVVVCEAIDRHGLDALEARIARVLSAPVELSDGLEVAVGASIGTGQVPGTGDLVRAIAAADERMYGAKRRRGSAS